MGGTVELTIDGDLAIARLAREHGNAINGDLADDLVATCQEAEADPSVRGMLLAARGKLFCPGLDLRELIALDRRELDEFLRRFSASLLALFGFSKPMVAALHGHAVAGGCVLSLNADWRVLKRGALVGLNEVRVGLPLPFGVAMILREAVGKGHLEEVALFGRNYKDEAAVAVGLVHELGPDEGFEGFCLERLAELASKDSRAFAITKRYLRSGTIERYRQNDALLRREFVEAWFGEETRARIEELVAGLEARGKG